jgi:hypothetical protein
MRRFVLPLSLAGLLVSASAALAGTCVFTVSMDTGTDVNNLDFKVSYDLVDGGTVEGTATRPECARAISGSFAARDNDDDKELAVSFIRLNTFSGPTPLLGCRIFYDSLEPVPSDFSVTVLNAGRGGEDDNVIPLPVVDVSDVDCPGELPEITTTTTTIPITTTTLDFGDQRCGFPISDGQFPTASDALYTLRAGVGVSPCPLCVCDLNDNGNLSAGDALRLLHAAVGNEIEYECPPC